MTVDNLCEFCTKAGLEECSLINLRPELSSYPELKRRLEELCPQIGLLEVDTDASNLVNVSRVWFDDPILDKLTISDESGEFDFSLRQFMGYSMLHLRYWEAFIEAVKMRITDPNIAEPTFKLREREILDNQEEKTYSVDVELPPEIIQLRDAVQASVNPRIGTELFNILYLRFDQLLRTDQIK